MWQHKAGKDKKSYESADHFCADTGSPCRVAGNAHEIRMETEKAGEKPAIKIIMG